MSLVPFDLNDPIPPSNSIEFGSQGDDFKRVWSVIADTDYGLLPGNQTLILVRILSDLTLSRRHINIKVYSLIYS